MIQPSSSLDFSLKTFTNTNIFDITESSVQSGNWVVNTGNNTLDSLLSETAISPTPEQTFAANDPVNQFLNKDYSEVLEKSIEKSKNKLGR